MWYVKLLSNVMRLGHVGDSWTNAVVLNNDFIIIFFKAIVVVLNNGFIIFKKLKCRCHQQRHYRVLLLLLVCFINSIVINLWVLFPF